MSYRSPQQYIDTSTARYFEKLQETISGSFARVAKSYAEKRKQEAERIAKEAKYVQDVKNRNDEAEQRVRNLTTGVIAKNPAFNFGDALNPEIDKYSDIKNSLDLNLIKDPKERANAQAMLSKIEALPTSLESGVINLTSLITSYDEGMQRLNQPGGIYGASIGEQVDYYEVLTNRIKGNRTVDIKTTDLGDYEPGFTLTPDGKKSQFFSVQKLESMFDSPDGNLVIIPDETADFIKMRDSVRGYTEKDKDKVFDENYLGQQLKRSVGDYTEVYRTVDVDSAVAKAEAQIQANADSMTPWQKVAFYNTQINPDNPLPHPDKLTSDELKENDKNFLDGYRDYFKNNYLPKEIVVERYKTPQQKTPKPTATQITQKQSEERAGKRLNDILKNPLTAIRSVVGENLAERSKNEQGDVIITLYPGDENEDTFNMNRKEDVARLAKKLEQAEYGADATTDKVITEIDKLIETRRQQRKKLP